MLNLKTANALSVENYEVCETQKGSKYLKIYTVDTNSGNTHTICSFADAVNNMVLEKGPGLYEFIFRLSYNKDRNQTDINPVFCSRV